MTPAARYKMVIDLVHQMMNIERPADSMVSAMFRGARYMGSSDRKNVRERFYRILRHYHRITWWIKHYNYTASARTYVCADSILNSEQTVATLQSRIFTGIDYAPTPLSDSEVKLLLELQGKPMTSDDMPDRVKYECPEWAWSPLNSAFGKKTKDQLEAMQVKNDVHLRVNTLKTKYDDVFEKLTKDGFTIERGTLSPNCIRVKGHPALTQHEFYTNGNFEIQNEGSQLIALCCDAKAGERIVDFCAGAGGKTLAIAASMNNKGSVVACDVLDGRLKRSRIRFRRAGVHNIETRPLSSERDPWVKRHKKSYDTVLIDAPCSGLGTWRGDPDKRWRQLGPGLSELVPLQAEILDSAARLVKEGGRLVYGTCSLLPEENETQIKNFLTAHPDFKQIDLPAFIPNTVRDGQNMKATPADHDCDGFFAAVLQRDEKVVETKNETK